MRFLVIFLLLTFNCYAMEVGKSTSFRKPIDEQLNELNRLLDKIILVLTGRVSFADGAISDGEDGENIDGQFQIISDTGSADTEFTVAHSLGRVPVGFVTILNDKGGTVYDSGTTWTASNIYLKCNTANCNISIFIF